MWCLLERFGGGDEDEERRDYENAAGGGLGIGVAEGGEVGERGGKIEVHFCADAYETFWERRRWHVRC